MNFVDDSFNKLSTDVASYQFNYQTGTSFLARKVLLLHSLKYLIYVNKKLKKYKEEGKVFGVEDLKQIKSQDNTVYLCQKMNENFENIINEKNEEQLHSRDIFKLIWLTFNSEVKTSIAISIIDGVIRILFSYLVLFLFQAVNNQNHSKAYLYCTILTFLWFISQLCQNLGLSIKYMLAPKIKATLSMFLYCKISMLSSFTLKASHYGTIINIIANDLTCLDERISFLYYFNVFFIVIIGFTLIIIKIIGFIGLISVFVILLIIPITHFISKLNITILSRLIALKDKRIQISSELIEGIKYIKLYGWEFPFKKQIDLTRQQQLDCLKKIGLCRSVQRALSKSIGFFCSFTIFLIALKISINFNSSFIFMILVMTSLVKFFAIYAMNGIDLLNELNVIFDRLTTIFNIKEIQIQQPTNQKESQNINIRFQSYSAFLKEHDNRPILSDINFYFQRKKLYGVTGSVGSGKSLFLTSILGQIPYHTGLLKVKGSIAYSQQEPVLFSETIKENIIFGRKFNQTLYNKAVNMSCLRADFSILPQKDKTMVGQKGITLSGGQKARLTLARAIYTNADIYLLDDPISAVDSKVAKQLFRKCVRRLSEEKIVILVSHQLSYIQQCDQILIFQDGKIRAKGTAQSVAKQLKKLKDILQQKQEDEEEQEQEAEVEVEVEDIENKSNPSKQNSFLMSPIGISLIDQDNKLLRFKEQQSEVSFRVYLQFFFNNKMNYFLIPLVILLFFLAQIILAIFYRLLAAYDRLIDINSTFLNGSQKTYWSLLTLILLTYVVILIVEYYLLNICITNSCKKAHQRMIRSIVRSPSSFFDLTPSGVLMNKLSNDLGTIDNNLYYALIQSVEGPVSTLIAIINISMINIQFLLPATIIVTVATCFFIYSRPAYIKCKQLFLESKNHLIHYVKQAVNGLTQIKLFKQRIHKMQNISNILNNTIKTGISFEMMMRSFGFYVTLILLLLLVAGMYLGVAQTTRENSGLYGATIVYLVTIVSVLQWTLKQIISTQGIMVSVQRIKMLQNIESQSQLRTNYDRDVGLEAQVIASLNGEDHHQEWPPKTTIQFQNFMARYRQDLPLTLKGLSFSINEREKVGIVGRTGAGKSSIIQALFRVFEPDAGSVYKIGGYDALKIGLHSLRQHISVIPQVPFLFKGTVRQNIDPFDTADDSLIWQVLEESGLATYVSTMQKGLDTQIENNSESFSMGQKQLVCLARALLRRNKFLVLDEATSNVDMKTDAFIQKVIRDKFKNTTVITIAHRLNTIADYDKVIVMRKGEIAEIGSPWQLIQKKGIFYEMVQHTGKNAEVIKKKAKLGRNKNYSENKIKK